MKEQNTTKAIERIKKDKMSFYVKNHYPSISDEEREKSNQRLKKELFCIFEKYQ